MAAEAFELTSCRRTCELRSTSSRCLRARRVQRWYRASNWSPWHDRYRDLTAWPGTRDDRVGGQHRRVLGSHFFKRAIKGAALVSGSSASSGCAAQGPRFESLGAHQLGAGERGQARPGDRKREDRDGQATAEPRHPGPGGTQPHPPRREARRDSERDPELGRHGRGPGRAERGAHVAASGASSVPARGCVSLSSPP
jgi:hypothetical protein